MADPKGKLFVPVGFRSDGTIHAFELDTSDRLKVLVDSITGNVTIAASENTFLNPTTILAAGSNNNLPAGASTQTILTVPANQRYLIQHFIYRYVGTVAGVTLIPQVNDGASTFAIARIAPPVSATFYEQTFPLMLEAGYTLELSIGGATLNDDYLAYAFGYRVK